MIDLLIHLGKTQQQKRQSQPSKHSANNGRNGNQQASDQHIKSQHQRRKRQQKGVDTGQQWGETKTLDGGPDRAHDLVDDFEDLVGDAFGIAGRGVRGLVLAGCEGAALLDGGCGGDEGGGNGAEAGVDVGGHGGDVEDGRVGRSGG